MNTQQPCYIVSVWKAYDTVDQNRNKQLLIEKFLWKTGIDFNVVEGYWQGNKEESIVLLNEDAAQIIATEHGQEAYMYIDMKGLASLHYPDGALMTILGRIKTSLTAPDRLCYTYDKKSGVYYYV